MLFPVTMCSYKQKTVKQQHFMATKLELLDLEVAHFENVRKHIPGYEEFDKKTIESLLSMGLLQVSTAAEYAVAFCSGTCVVSRDSNDLSNGDDVKLSSVRTCSYGKRYSAPVTGIKNKTGNLRVQVYDRKQNMFYYFVFPHESYKHIPSSSNIEIPFDINGNPRRVPSRPVIQNWWNYEVSTFEHMSTHTWSI